MIPKRLQGLFWSNDLTNLDLDKDKDLIIHQILTYGSLNDFKWLKSIYPKEEIKKIFITYPKKNYAPSRFNFVKNYLLGIKEDLPHSKYVKSTF